MSACCPFLRLHSFTALYDYQMPGADRTGLLIMKPFTFSFAVFIFLSMASALGQEAREGPSIRLNPDSDSVHSGSVEVVGLPTEMLEALSSRIPTMDGWQALFFVQTGRHVTAGQPPLMGTYAVSNDVIRFKPRFPLLKGMSYTARLDLDLLYALSGKPTDGLLNHLEMTFDLPAATENAVTIVSKIYPTIDTLPENHLKFYIYFSSPMKRGQAYRLIQLKDENDQPVEAPFLELEPELWDQSTRRLTILFDPGRIKRGLRPHHELGMALKPGRKYRLVIAEEMIDSAGLPLVRTFEKSFTVKEADRKSPDFRSWSLNIPRAQTRQPLVITFDESLDQGLLGHMLVVKDSAGNIISGNIEVGTYEKVWRFIPLSPWKKGRYAVHVDARIEDLAGNTLNYLFDTDIALEGNLTPDRTPSVTLNFNVGSP